MEIGPRLIAVYRNADGKLPYLEWLETLKDFEGRAAITRRIKRLQAGNFGDCKRFGPVTELRVDFGPGYRVYLGQKGRTLVILLVGGDKSSQRKDFKNAQRYWNDYQTHGAASLGTL